MTRLVMIILSTIVSAFLMHGQTDQLINDALKEANPKMSIDDITWRVSSSHTSSLSGITHTYLSQTFNNQRIIGTESSVHSIGSQKTAKHNISFEQSDKLIMTNQLSLASELSITDLAKSALDQLEIFYKPSSIQIKTQNISQRTASISAGNVTNGDILAEGVYFFDETNRLQYGYIFIIDDIHSSDWWEVLVNAKNGIIISKINYTISCTPTPLHNHTHQKSPPFTKTTSKKGALPTNTSVVVNNNCYLVYPYPLESPLHGPQSMVTNPANATASPFGWHDTNGINGAEYTTTRGNNVYAKEDQAGDNEGTIGISPDGGANLVFNNSVNTSLDPSQYVLGAVTNLFYWNNLVHDVMHFYGFTEGAGNFQNTNYSGLGSGNDFVYADAQDNGNCNANFATPPDGSNPRMQMYTCANTTPNPDSDLDNGVIVHEYGHGITNRLVGGRANSGCLSNVEQMGEGWSDYYGMIMTMDANDLSTDSRGMGNYFTGMTVDAGGIRPFPYSTDMNINPQTYGHIPNLSVPHGVGSVWATMLWELTWALIEKYSFNADIYNGNGGNNISLQLVTEALKLMPCSPGFVDGRDAILLADSLINNAENSCLIWNAFAKRGLGFSASQGSSSSTSDGVEAFDLPPGVPSFCLDQSDFFATSHPHVARGCDTFHFDISFYTNTGFQYIVALTPDGLEDSVKVVLSSNSITVPSQVQVEVVDTVGLTPMDTFHFSIIATNGPETDTLPLKISRYGTPTSIILDSPPPNSVTINDFISLSWLKDTESTKYQIQIGEDATFTNLIIDSLVTHTSFLFNNDGGSEFKYWRVRGINDCQYGPYSYISNFAHRTCGYTFLDPGGENDYPHNIDTTYILCPENDTSSLLVDFTEFSIFENSASCSFDFLEIYQGDSKNPDKLIDVFCEDDLNTLPNGGNIISTDITGCLTFRFRSSSVNNSTGWKANIECVDCPTIAIDTIVINQSSCDGTTDGSLLIQVPPMLLDYTYKMAKGTDTIENTTGTFINLDSGNYELIVYASQFPDCEGAFSQSVFIPRGSAVLPVFSQGCAYDTSSMISLDFQCVLPNFHSYLLPDSIVSQNHIYNNLPAGTYQIIGKDTIANLTMIDSTVLLIPSEVNPPSAQSIALDKSETLDFLGAIADCPGSGLPNAYINSNRIAITDGDTSSTSITIPVTAFSPEMITINFEITHTWAGDLNIYMESPTGTRHPLFTNAFHCGQDNINITVSDTSSFDISDYRNMCLNSFTGFGVQGPPYGREGNFKAETSLSTIFSNGISGTWTLKVYDGFGFDQGFIESFSMHINRGETVWYADSMGKTEIYRGDTLDPFDLSLNLLNHGETDTLSVYAQCAEDICKSELTPIIIRVHELNSIINNIVNCNSDNLMLNKELVDAFPMDKDIMANMQLSADALINHSLDLRLTAGQTINLLPGFEVEIGAVLEADITPCINQN